MTMKLFSGTTKLFFHDETNLGHNEIILYYRLSRDEDEELNSLMNQRSIIESYALSHGYTIVGESCDDNISGMHFDRDGIEQLTEAVDAGLIDAVIVKDLSRLGRHRTQTALYIDYLRKNRVRVLSATENISRLEPRMNVGLLTWLPCIIMLPLE